jgi:hypothetical protein
MSSRQVFLWLRQLTVITDDLNCLEGDLSAASGVRLAYRDPNVERSYSIVNGIFPAGNDFLETVAPLGSDAAASCFLARRGAGGYLAVISTDDLSRARARVETVGA